MRIIRPILAMLLLLVAAGLSPRPAYAHNSTIRGIVNLRPEVPTPGQSVRLQVDMLDGYNADLPGARIRAAFAPDGKPWAWSATLKEEPVGVYTGDLRTPEAGQAVILLEATLPDGKWFGELFVRVGTEGRPVFQEPVDFIHEDQLKQQAAASPLAPVQAPPPAAASQPRPETASVGPATAATQPPGPTPAPPVSATQLNQTLARASRPSPVPWVLAGAAALGIGLLLWYRRSARNSPR